jgi:hypothetical protein
VRYPGEVYRILGGLASLVGKLPQLLQQLERPMQGWVDGDLVTIDGGEFVDDPIAAVSALSVYFIEEALPAAGGLRRAFEQGQSAIAYASYSGELDEHVQRVPVDVPPAPAFRVVENTTEWGIQGGDGVRVVQQSSGGADHREEVAREFARGSGSGMPLLRRSPGGGWQPVEDGR